ncbi:MAG TPA: cobalamin-binding protein [Bacillaceae bacterium]
MKVISICPSNTEILAWLEKLDCLIAVDDYSDWPSEIKELPKLGPDLSIDMDKTESLQPDLVLASLSVPGMERNIQELKRRGIPHIVLNPGSLADIAEDIRTVGKHLGDEELGNRRADDFLREVDKYREETATLKEFPSFYWEWWPKPVFTPGQSNWLTEISKLAGGFNLFQDKEEASVQTDWEEVKNRNPDYIFMVWVGVQESKMKPELLLKRPDWPAMDAIRNNRIFVLEEALYCRPSPRLLEGLKKLKGIMASHPR